MCIQDGPEAGQTIKVGVCLVITFNFTLSNSYNHTRTSKIEKLKWATGEVKKSFFLYEAERNVLMKDLNTLS